jgi:HSP20 family protein
MDMFSSSSFAESPLLAEFRRLEQEFDDFFAGWTPWTGGIRSLPAGTFPAINIGSNPDGVSVYVFAPGLDPKSLEVSLQQNILSVSGQRDIPAEENASYYRQERFGGSFRRVITLPEDVDPDKVDATYRDGIVQITVQRRESAKPRQIEIH